MNGLTRAISRGMAGLLACAVAFGTGSCTRTDDAITLELWTLSLRPAFTGFVEGMVDAFEREHPGVEVVWVDVPFSAVERKLIAAAAAGRAPDVVNLSDLMFARFAGAGAFLDLAGFLPSDPADRYHAGALAVGRIGNDAGGLFALPWYLTTQARIVNAGLLTEQGLAPGLVSSDWPGLREQARAYHERTGGRLFTQPLGQDSQLPVMMLADGIVPFRSEAGGRLRADLSRDEIVAWVEAWVSLYRSGAMPRQAATNGFEHLIEVYQDERVGVLNTGANFLGRVRGVSQRVYDQTEVGTPIVGALGRAHIAVMPVCVSSRTEHPRLAAELAWFLTSPENQLAFCRLAPILPSTPASLADPFFAGATPDEIERGDEKIGRARAIVAGALRDGVAFTPAMECWPTLRRAFNEQIKRALLGDAPVERVLASIETEWNAILDDADRQRARSGSRRLSISAVPTPGPVEPDAGARP